MNQNFLDFLRIYTNAVTYLSLGNHTKYQQMLELAKVELASVIQNSYLDEREIFLDWADDMSNQCKELQNIIKNKKLTRVEGCPDFEQFKQENSFMSYKIPKTTFDDIAGLENVKEEVKLKAIFPYKYPELYKTFNKKKGGGILLYGLPGTGKTMIAEAIAYETKAKFFPIKCSDLGSKYFGETERKISRLFEEAKQQDKAVIFFDEIEGYMGKRREGVMGRVVPEFLAQMQGVGGGEDKQKLLIIAATNKPWEIDSAFLRPGRFDEVVYVPLPDRQSRRQILNLRLKDIPCEQNVDFETLLDLTEGYNGADVDYLCEKAKAIAINQLISGERQEQVLRMQDFVLAQKQMRSSVRIEDIERLRTWNKIETF